MEEGVALALYPPALVVRQMPAQRVELVHRHYLQKPQHFLLAEEVARFVQEQAAPAEARFVGDVTIGDLYARSVELVQLEHLVERLAGVDEAGRL